MKTVPIVLFLILVSFYEASIAQLPEIYNDNPRKRELKTFDKLINDYSERIKQDSINHELFYQRGRAYGKKGQFDKAIQDFSTAIELDSTVPDYYVRLAIALELQQNYKNAQKFYELASVLDPLNKDAFYGLGNCALQLHNYQDAIAYFNQQINLVPMDYASYTNKAIALYRLKQYESSIKTLNKSLSIVDHKIAYQYLGLNFYYLNKPQTAIPYFTKAFNKDDQESLLHYYRGMSYWQLGKTRKACSDIDKSKELNYHLAKELDSICN